MSIRKRIPCLGAFEEFGPNNDVTRLLANVIQASSLWRETKVCLVGAAKGIASHFEPLRMVLKFPKESCAELVDCVKYESSLFRGLRLSRCSSSRHLPPFAGMQLVEDFDQGLMFHGLDKVAVEARLCRPLAIRLLSPAG